MAKYVVYIFIYHIGHHVMVPWSYCCCWGLFTLLRWRFSPIAKEVAFWPISLHFHVLAFLSSSKKAFSTDWLLNCQESWWKLYVFSQQWSKCAVAIFFLALQHMSGLLPSFFYDRWLTSFYLRKALWYFEKHYIVTAGQKAHFSGAPFYIASLSATDVGFAFSTIDNRLG